MSAGSGDEFRLALRAELRDLVADDGVAAAVIARYRASRRRLSCLAALGVVLAVIGVLLGIVTAPGHSGPAELRLSSYRLRLPHLYQVTRAAPAISPGSQQKVAAAVGSDGRCVSMQLTSPFRPGPAGDPNVPRGAPEVAVGSYHAWLTEAGCGPRGPHYGLVFEMAAPGGQIQDLMIESSGLSRAAFLSLVSANLSSQQPGTEHER